jgi:phosphohistidine swiveling domain-containing protein
VSLADYDKAQQVIVDPKYKVAPIAHGIPGCNGVATGVVVRSAEAARASKVDCILVTLETNPDDIGGMFAAKGIITMTGGSTCHAAVVARGMNKPCIVGVGLVLSKFPEGSIVSVDGGTGRIWQGAIDVIDGSKNVVAKEYLDMLRTALGYVPIVDGMDAGGAKEVMYHAHPSPQDQAADDFNIKALLKQVEHLYVDLRASRIDHSEQYFYDLFDEQVDSGSDLYYKVLAHLPDTDRKRVTVIGGPYYGDIPNILEVNSLETLVLAEGLVFMGKLNMKDPAVKKVLEWRKGEEFKTVSYGQLGTEGSKSFISDVQALQTR